MNDREIVCVYVCVCVCECVNDRESVRVCVCVCVKEKRWSEILNKATKVKKKCKN